MAPKGDNIHVYAVVGKISGFFPEIKVRIANSRSFVEIDPSVVFESVAAVRDFPEEWKNAVLMESDEADKKLAFLKQLVGSKDLGDAVPNTH